MNTKPTHENLLSFLHDNDDEDSIFKFSDEFKFERFLGQGAFGTVIQAKYLHTGQTCAIKVIDKTNFSKSKLEYFRMEAEILESLDHPNIVKFIFCKETTNQLFLVMELVEGINLSLKIRDMQEVKKLFNQRQIRDIITKVLCGVDNLHSKKIIHRDLKPENIIVKLVDHEVRELKIIDFGLSVQKHWQGKVSGKFGTPIYFAPEMSQNLDYTNAVDIWSVGIMFYILFSGGVHPLYDPETDTSETYFEKLKCFEWVFPPNMDSLARNFFLKLVAKNPDERFTAKQALAHPWITGKSMETMPMTAKEQIKVFDTEQTFIKILQSTYFLCFLSTVATKIEENMNSKAGKPGLLESPRKRNFIIRPGSGVKKSIELLPQPLSEISPSKKGGNKERSISMVDLSPNKMRTLVQVTPGVSKFSQNNSASFATTTNTSITISPSKAAHNTSSTSNKSVFVEQKQGSPLKKKVSSGAYERFDFQKSLRSSLNYNDFQKPTGPTPSPTNMIPINTNKNFEIKLKKPLTSSNQFPRGSTAVSSSSKTHSNFYNGKVEDLEDEERSSPFKFKGNNLPADNFHLPKISASPSKPKSGKHQSLSIQTALNGNSQLTVPGEEAKKFGSTPTRKIQIQKTQD